MHPQISVISIAGKKRRHEKLKELAEEKKVIKCAYDNDVAGRNALNALQTLYGDSVIVDDLPQFPKTLNPKEYNDWSDYLRFETEKAAYQQQLENEEKLELKNVMSSKIQMRLG